MSFSRRRFLLGAGGLLAAPLFPELLRAAPAMPMADGPRMAPQLAEPNQPLVNPATLPRFVDTLPLPPVARPIGQREHPAHPGRRLPLDRKSVV